MSDFRIALPVHAYYGDSGDSKTVLQVICAIRLCRSIDTNCKYSLQRKVTITTFILGTYWQLSSSQRCSRLCWQLHLSECKTETWIRWASYRRHMKYLNNFSLFIHPLLGTKRDGITLKMSILDYPALFEYHQINQGMVEFGNNIWVITNSSVH